MIFLLDHQELSKNKGRISPYKMFIQISVKVEISPVRAYRVVYSSVLRYYSIKILWWVRELFRDDIVTAAGISLKIMKT